MLICDGPCHGILDYTKMMEYPDCGHRICKWCQFNSLSVPNADASSDKTVLVARQRLITWALDVFTDSGSPGCCVSSCVRQTLINRVPLDKYRHEAQAHGTPFVGVKQSSTRITPTACRSPGTFRIVPTELLDVRILILGKNVLSGLAANACVWRSFISASLSGPDGNGDLIDEYILSTDSIVRSVIIEPVKSHD
ncbi:unnamed protein product [Angiostrongylus costaricensis]|uniref:RING-type domain-containing protein n=1 Tax=Angiostrongylus costaricensis TaxID=334426 RepID=A0A0R3PHX1_ANGCS|nr:unnamed protein product [Angiostrongylus costaricensis]